FGSGIAMVASVPVISTMPARWRGDSKLKMLCDDWPPSNWANALTCVGTSTLNSSPALGPEPMTRTCLALEPTAATRRTEPNVCTNAVRLYGPISNRGPAPCWNWIAGIWFQDSGYGGMYMDMVVCGCLI